MPGRSAWKTASARSSTSRRTDASAVVFTLAGDPAAARGDERLSVARIGNDLPNATYLRSQLRAGAAVGTVSGPVAFDADEYHCAVALEGMRREIRLHGRSRASQSGA